MVHSFRKMKLDIPDILIGSCGLAAIQMPIWVQDLNDILIDVDGFYKFTIFVVTISVLLARRNYYKNKKNLED